MCVTYRENLLCLCVCLYIKRPISSPVSITPKPNVIIRAYKKRNGRRTWFTQFSYVLFFFLFLFFFSLSSPAFFFLLIIISYFELFIYFLFHFLYPFNDHSPMLPAYIKYSLCHSGWRVSFTLFQEGGKTLGLGKNNNHHIARKPFGTCHRTTTFKVAFTEK